MDQTPIFLHVNPRKRLISKGRRQSQYKNLPLIQREQPVYVTASGKMLAPYMIFKGAPNGCIKQQEFPMFSKDGIYVCQKNAWMDEVCMLNWVEQVLAPYLSTAPHDVVPIIVLDQYQCHMMGLVVSNKPL